jgi:predicted nucleic acid-binding Zn finger protein
MSFITPNPELIALTATAYRNAQAQASEYEIKLNRRQTGYVIGKNGTAYHVSERACSCPHFVKRCDETGAVCKHIILLRAYVQTTKGQQDESTRRAAVKKDRDLLW